MAKKNTDNYKDLYYEERFKGLTTLLNGHMIHITDILEAIEKQTTKTNGRVTELEAFKQKAQTILDTRESNCPVVEKMDKRIDGILLEKYADLNFVLRHPKLFVGAIVVMVLLSLAAVVENNPFKVFTKKVVNTEAIK